MTLLTDIVIGIWTIGKIIMMRDRRKARERRAAFWAEHDRKIAEITARTRSIEAETQRILQR